MGLPHRIAAGGIVFKDNTLLLVRYHDNIHAGSYWVGPGGKLEDHENVVQAIIRETKEETGVTVQPQRVIAIEDLISLHFKMIKVWMVCEFIEGKVTETEGARQEKIVEAGWLTRAQLTGEVVFPSLLLQHDWKEIQSESWQVECLPSRLARF